MQETIRKPQWPHSLFALLTLPQHPWRPLRSHWTLLVVFGKDGLAMNASFVIAFLLRFGSLAGIEQANHLNLLLIMNGVGLYLYFFSTSGLYNKVFQSLFTPVVFQKFPVMLALHIGTVSTLLLITNNVAISRLHFALTYLLFWALTALIRWAGRPATQPTKELTNLQ